MRTAFAAILCLSLFTHVLAAERSDPAGAAPAPAISVDFSDVPDMKEWALNLQKDVQAFYPVIAAKLGSDGFAPPEIKIVLKQDVKGAGHSQGSTIFLGADYYKAKPTDTGTVIFHVTRSMQAYTARNAPAWLVTGIADYIRWWNYEPAEKRRRVDPRSAKYTNGFNDTAAFLVWLEKTCDKDIVRKLNEPLYKNSYSQDLFTKLTGKDAPELWKEFVASLRKEADQEAQKAVDRSIPKPSPKLASVSFTDIGVVEFAPPEDGLLIRYTLDGTFPTAKSFACCAPIKVASTLTLRAAAFNKDGKCSEAAEVACVSQAPDAPAPKPGATAAINVDFSEVPDLKEWALRAQKESEDYYGVIAGQLKSDGHTPSRQITYIFTEGEGILGPGIPAFAIAAESKIYFRAAHIRANKNDFGMVIHELAHIIQNYGYGKNTPSWLVEGIADYVRWEHWEPLEKRRRINPLRAKVTNGYSDTARFLTFVEKTYDKDIVLKLNEALRKNAYKDELFKKYAGKEIAELWKEFIESLPK